MKITVVALQMAKIYKYRPRKTFLNIKLHHFRDYVDQGEITIHKVQLMINVQIISPNL